MKTDNEIINDMLNELNAICSGWETYSYQGGDCLYVHNTEVSVSYDKKHNWYKSVSNVYSTDETLLRGFGNTATEALNDLQSQIKTHLNEVISILKSISGTSWTVINEIAE